jgi:ferredoxin-NADP reductase
MSIVSKVKVIKIKKISELINEYFLRPNLKLHQEPGQFLQLSLELVDSSSIWPESRSFSFASYERDDKLIRLIIKKQGKYTTRIFNELKEGSECTIKLPYGDFLPPMDDTNIICIAGGTGISPFLSFIDYYEKEELLNHLFIFYSAKTFNDLIDYSVIKNKLGDNLRVFLTKEVNNLAINRRIELLDITSISNKNTPIYICGSSDFIKFFKHELSSIGYNNLYYDEWT